jgi:hypothetical protein
MVVVKMRDELTLLENLGVESSSSKLVQGLPDKFANTDMSSDLLNSLISISTFPPC